MNFPDRFLEKIQPTHGTHWRLGVIGNQLKTNFILLIDVTESFLLSSARE